MNAIAIDDEPIALQIIQEFASKVPFINLHNTFTNPFEALLYMKENEIDLIFLDINMPDITGIEFIQSLSNPPQVIFTTAYSEYAVQSFDLDASDYLLKPFSFVRFLKACNKVNELKDIRKSHIAESKENFMYIKDGYETIKVMFDDILYWQSFGNYCKVILKDNQILICRMTLNELEGILPAGFIRVHRAYIIQQSKIARFNRNSIFIQDVELPIGPSYKEVINRINS